MRITFHADFILWFNECTEVICVFTKLAIKLTTPVIDDNF